MQYHEFIFWGDFPKLNLEQEHVTDVLIGIMQYFVAEWYGSDQSVHMLQANLTLGLGEQRSRFGTSLAVVNTANQVFLEISCICLIHVLPIKI